MRGWVETFRAEGAQPWRFRLRSGNGFIVAQSEGYATRSNVRRIARRLANQLGWRCVDLHGPR